MPLPHSTDRIALIGDVHAEDELLEAALDCAKAQSVSRILCVGDIADGPGNVDRCVELLIERRALAVRGNHERWLLAAAMRDLPDATRADDLADGTLAYLNALPTTRSIATPLGGALLCHGLGANDMASVAPDDVGYAIEVNANLQDLKAEPKVRLVFNGHTHRRMVRHFAGLTIVNAGTLYRHHDPGFVLVDFDTGDVSWVSLSRAAADLEPLGSLPMRQGLA